MISIILLIVVFVALIIATITDFQKREVADWLNFSLIAIGLGLNAIRSIVEQDWMFIVLALGGLAFGYIFGLMMVYSGQWGGGDAKNLMGLGACFGAFTPLFFVPNLGMDLLVSMHAPAWMITYNVLFMPLLLINIFLVGAVYGVVWTLIKAGLNYKKVRPHLVELLQSKKGIIARICILSLAFIFLLAAYFSENPFKQMFVFFVFATLFFPLLLLLVKIVESKLHVFDMKLSTMTPGEWVYEDVWLTREKMSMSEHIERMRKQRLVCALDQSSTQKIAQALDWKWLAVKNKEWKRQAIEQDILHAKKKIEQDLEVDFDTLARSGTFSKDDLEVLDEHLAYHPTKEYITGPRELGITQEQIARLKKEGFKVLKVKIGIPFIPAFLIGFVVTIVWGSIVFLGVGLL